jgi:hypothetical protein
MQSRGYREAITYLPTSRYWPLQGIETGIFLALALALAGFCFWWLGRRRTWRRHGHALVVIMNAIAGMMRPKDLGTLDGSRGGLIIPPRVKARRDPALAVLGRAGVGI